MSAGFFNVPKPQNEPINSYAPNTPQREALKAKLVEMRNSVADVPMYIGSEEVRTNKKQPLTCPHDHQHILGYYHEGDESHVHQAIETSLAAREQWANLPWENRVAIFLESSRFVSHQIPNGAKCFNHVRTVKKCLSS